MSMTDLSKKNRYDVLPWIEKYRPSSLDGIISHQTVVQVLRKTIADQRLQHLLFHGSSGTGKCLAPETPVIMYDGSIREAQHVKAGDLLMGDDNTPRTVINTTTGRDTMYRIVQENGDDYIVNSEHILSLKLSPPFIQRWDDAEKRYRLIWFEDFVPKEKSFTVPDENPTREKALEALETYKGLIESVANKRGDICDVSVKDYLRKSPEWRSSFKGFKSGRITCWTRKAVPIDPYVFGHQLGLHKCIPDDYKINDEETRLQLLAGFVDAGDHNRFAMDNCFEFCEKSKTLFNDIVFIARSLGYEVSVAKVVDEAEQQRAIVYGPCLSKDPPPYEIQVEEVGTGKYNGFEIDGNRRFLLGDFTVTHNTSTIVACARELYGDKMDLMTLNINASEERGIEVVRNRIQQFVNGKVIHGENDKCIFKLVILDEADAMTADAQAMLRKVIEKYSHCTRFCLICNYIKKITPALQSRCACYRFPPLKAEDIRKKILEVSIAENVNITEDGIICIIKRSKGDMRKVLNILQSANMTYDRITELSVNKCIGYPNSADVERIWKSLLSDDFETAYNTILGIKVQNSYSLVDIVSEISTDIIHNNRLADPARSVGILRHLSQIEYNLTSCTAESIQLSALVGIFKLY